MIETNEEGQRQVNELLKNKDDEVFNDWEQEFIRDLASKKYEHLTGRQKSVVTRLYGWLSGK